MSVLRVQAKGGLSALFETAAALPFLFPVGSKDSTAAIKNAGAFAPVADTHFVVSGGQALGIVLRLNFCFTSFQRNQRRFLGTVGASLAHTENAGIVAASVGNAAVIPCFQASGVLGNPWIAFAQVDKIHSCSARKAATLAHQRTAYARRVVNTLALCAADQLDKSLSIARCDRKYFSSTSGSKMSISDKVDSFPVLRNAVES